MTTLKQFNLLDSKIEPAQKSTMIPKDGKHYYKTPNGDVYPSVTTMLSATIPPEKKKGLQDWRDKVGNAEADKISKRATDIGTVLHHMAELYLNNSLDLSDEFLPDAKKHFDRLQPYLNRINNINETEVALYHDELKLAGTVDCVAQYDGVPSIIDFKTSKKIKYEVWIEDYFLQATLYSMMYFHLTGTKISQIVILISSEEDGAATHFVKKIDDYVDSLFQRISQFNILEAAARK